MFSKLKLLFKDTVIYGTSTILARSLNYLLVPLYANKLTTFDNGIQTIIYANIALANVVFAYGLETSYLKVASDSADRESDETPLFSTAFITLLLTSTIFSLAIVFFAPFLAGLIEISVEDAQFLRYAALILWLDTMLVIPFAELRLKRKAVHFAVARVAGVIAVVISSIILIVPLNAGLHGVFIGQAIGSFASLLLVIPVFSKFRLFFSSRQLREMLRIGLPYVPTGIAGLLIHLIDRNLLIRIQPSVITRIYGEGYQPSDIVGIYGRIAAFGVILQLFIQVFRFAWQPFFLQHSKDPDAPGLFRHVMNISSLVVMFLALAASYFVPDIVRCHYAGKFYLLPPRYWIGLSFLPWIFLSYVFDMVSTNLSAGILITGNTRCLPAVTFAGAAVTAASCWFLIPLGGMDGAAFAIVAGTLVMCLVMAWYSLKYYPLKYDWMKLCLLLVAGIALAWAQISLDPLFGPGVAGITLKSFLLLLYLLLSLAMFREEGKILLVKVRSRIPRRQ
ncbi:MAG: oligosaccharide flippase family protein [Chlorobiaceae bacterium]|nr:oligosaccharide flippase family protein [Chlorobiaceae bacterium]NTW10371.1 oligosaccharide flippase family protein [Chlorobiaceae bacterium]